VIAFESAAVSRMARLILDPSPMIKVEMPTRAGGLVMNRDIVQGKWKQLRGEVKRWWGDLTDDDLDVIDGNRDKLVGMLQERYGYSREKAESEVNTRLHDFEEASRH
jgi:uncharacterized protein YjbJ (UPF0337 family)